MNRPVPDTASKPLSTQSERRRERARSARLIAVFLLGCAGFAGPLLRAASHAAPPGAWPRPFVFLFGFWLLLIVLIALALGPRHGE